MVAVINTGTSLRRALLYNEQKVEAGLAVCLLAANYPKDAGDLTLSQKLQRLVRQAALNERVTRPSVHISLNFAPGEQLPDSQLRRLAEAYMQQIGFGEQPYLAYRHDDAGHPHIHLVSLKVRADGSRIDMHNIGRKQSEQARQALEQAFRLTPAQHGDRQQAPGSLRPHPRQVLYGRTDTKHAIQRVLDAVVPHYRFTSLPELNAVLGLYRLQADRGSVHSRVYRHRGLLYRVLDENGKPVGVPIKASAFQGAPTLETLEKRFIQNAQLRLPAKTRLKNSIALALRHPSVKSLPELVKALEKEGVHAVLRKNTQGHVYGLTYVDHHTRCVFNGSALGKAYSAQAVQERCLLQSPPPAQEGTRVHFTQAAVLPAPSAPAKGLSLSGTGAVVEAILQPVPTVEYVPAQLRKGRRRKKRQRSTPYTS